jgi:peroxiredoxin
MRAWILGIVGLFSLPAVAWTDEYPVLPIGRPAPAWSSLPGADGKEHSLSDLADKKAVVLVFFANHCPDCQDYLDRILTIAKDYKDKGVATVLMSVSRMEDDSLEHMTELAKTKKFPCAYLKDESQAIGKKYGASATPEVFVLDGAGKLAYHGAVDDHWKPSKVKRPHVRLALDEILAGKPVSVPTTETQGCFIEYEEE